MVGARLVRERRTKLEIDMFNRPKWPSVYELHSLKEPTPYKVNDMIKRRDEIIMACLRGGKNIDAAIEAGDRLFPKSDIEAEQARYYQRYDAWKTDGERIRVNSSNHKAKMSHWWWPF